MTHRSPTASDAVADADVAQPLPLSYGRETAARPLWPVFACESLSSVGTTLLMVGIFFFTEHYFRWGLRQNFLLAAGQGGAYVLGSLGANGLARRLGRRRALITIYLVLVALPLIAGAMPTGTTRAGLVAVLLAYTFVAALNWPLLESLATSDADAHQMSRRVGAYNLTWSATNVIAFAASGTIIESWRGGVFVVPAVMHLLSAITIALNSRVEPPGGEVDADALGHAHEPPEPELLAKRTLALWLARIALPATYVVVYSLAAMMPLLPVMRPLETSTRTLVASAWMASRWVMFLYLGATVWWHTRPRILLIAAAVMGIAFLGVTVRPSDVFGGWSQTIDLSSMIAWQLLLGAVMGVIYAGSLYFGMVLSEGSTEHGGYHEALIGLGSVLGPGTAALTTWQWPGDLRAGVTAVCCVIALSVAAAGVATIKAAKPPTR